MTQTNDQPLFENLKSSGLDEGVAEAALKRLIEAIPPERLARLVLFGIIEQDDLGTALGWDVKTLKNKIARREIPFVRLGRRNVVLVGSMRAWLQKKEVKTHGSY